MNPLSPSKLKKIAQAFVLGARHELYLTPKPGLVDRVDSGAHADLSFAIMTQSIGIVSDYLEALVLSLISDEPFSCQQQIAIDAESRMMSVLGTNTHKGYIFLAGMLLIACWHAKTLEEALLRKKLAELSASFFQHATEKTTNGSCARKKFNTRGIIAEALEGFPSLFEVALPAFRKCYASSTDYQHSAFYMMAKLMQSVEDTTTLHRGGMSGLRQIREDGDALERIIDQKENYIQYLEEQNRYYIRENLTMGGVADLMGLTFGYLIALGEIDDNLGCAD